MIEIRTPDGCVALSQDECWRLYVMLGINAPFVRNRLSVIRQGGTGSVSVSTADERREVLEVLSSGRNRALTPGLRSLQAALNGGDV